MAGMKWKKSRTRGRKGELRKNVGRGMGEEPKKGGEGRRRGHVGGQRKKGKRETIENVMT